MRQLVPRRATSTTGNPSHGGQTSSDSQRERGEDEHGGWRSTIFVLTARICDELTHEAPSMAKMSMEGGSRQRRAGAGVLAGCTALHSPSRCRWCRQNQPLRRHNSVCTAASRGVNARQAAWLTTRRAIRDVPTMKTCRQWKRYFLATSSEVASNYSTTSTRPSRNSLISSI